MCYVFKTMVKDRAKTFADLDLNDACLALLEEEILKGKRRIDLSRELDCSPSTIKRWLDRDQVIQQQYAARILNVYGGAMDSETLRKLVTAFKDKQDLIDAMIELAESTDETYKESAFSLLKSLARKAPK